MPICRGKYCPSEVALHTPSGARCPRNALPHSNASGTASGTAVLGVRPGQRPGQLSCGCPGRVLEMLFPISRRPVQVQSGPCTSRPLWICCRPWLGREDCGSWPLPRWFPVIFSCASAGGPATLSRRSTPSDTMRSHKPSVCPTAPPYPPLLMIYYIGQTG